MITLKFELDEVNVILNSLGNMPYAQVFKVIQKLQEQAAPQVQAAQQQEKETGKAEG